MDIFKFKSIFLDFKFDLFNIELYNISNFRNQKSKRA